MSDTVPIPSQTIPYADRSLATVSPDGGVYANFAFYQWMQRIQAAVNAMTSNTAAASKSAAAAPQVAAVAAAPPPNAQRGQLWWDETHEGLYIWLGKRWTRV